MDQAQAHHHITTPAKKAGSSRAGGLDVPRSRAALLTQHRGAGQHVVTVDRDHRTHGCVRQTKYTRYIT